MTDCDCVPYKPCKEHAHLELTCRCEVRDGCPDCDRSMFTQKFTWSKEEGIVR